ncbi:hypothetical protein [Aureivirga sp. CE67]|uniref:hypothetical protein n=1 Tax=Aureivirga sp. CE67 TaxID=1788983 RepID=UPI0018CBDBC4|nr:hypothetical protein [Aureivirga sp. CE67]
MKKIIFILFGMFSIISLSQEKDIESFSFSVVMPSSSEDLSQKNISKLETKIHKIISRYGISGENFFDTFLIFPKIDINDESVIEGMRNITVIDLDLTLFVQERKSKRIFSSYTQSLRGSGKNKEKAITNAFVNISTNKKNLKDFLKNSKNKIVDYYNNNCELIIKDLDFLISTQNFRKAISQVFTVPREASKCYTKVQEKSVIAFSKYQIFLCNKNIHEAEVELSKNEYRKALQKLKEIDVSSPCSKKAKELISKISKHVDEKEIKEEKLLLKKYNDKLDMEKYRLNIMRDIAREYYRSKPSTIIYKSLF